MPMKLSGGGGGQDVPQQLGGNNGSIQQGEGANAAASAVTVNDRNSVMMTSAANASGSGAADVTNNGSNTNTSVASTVPSSTSAAANSEASRRISKESLASSTASDGGIFDTQTQQQQANLLNLLQRQQIQMGNLNVANNNSVAAMVMMLQQQQGGGGGNVVNGGGVGGTASHRNSLTGSVNTPGSSFTMGGATDVNSLLMNMNYNNMKPNTTNAGVPTNSNNSNSNNNGNGEKGPLLLVPPKKSKNKHKQTFAMKLMNILSIKECQSSIRWMPNGLSFCIVDPKLLVEKVLPVYFKEAKYTSFVSCDVVEFLYRVVVLFVVVRMCVFAWIDVANLLNSQLSLLSQTRKLNRWGFKHYSLPINESTSTSAIADKEMSIYSHDKFRRDDPGLCHSMDGGHRRRNALKEDEKTRQFYSQLKPEVRDLLRQGQLQQQQQGVVATVGEDGAASGGGGGVGMEGVIGSDNQLTSQAHAVTSSASNVVPNAATVAGLEVQLKQMQAMQLQLLQQQAQQQQQQQQSNQMMDMSSFMTNNAAASMLGAAAGGGNNGMAAAAMGGDSNLKNNFLLASANQQGLMGLNMMGGGGGGDVGTGGNDNMNTNAAMAAAAMTAAAQGGQLSNTLGMRRTSLGFMPYLPVGNVGRRDSLGSVFSVGNCHTFDGKIESTFDDVGGGGGGLNNTSTVGVSGTGKEGYEPGTSGGGDPTSKLNVLQGVIANEQMKQQQSLVQNSTSNNDGLNAV